MTNNFKERDADRLAKILLSNNILSSPDIEALVYGLIEIAESMDEIYSKIIPEIISANGHDELMDKVWDLREAFRHVQYHIDDGKFKEL